MSVEISYKFKIKEKNAKELMNKLIKDSILINFDYLLKMPDELKEKTSYDNWACEKFGHSYKWTVDEVYIKKDDILTILISGNKTYFNLEPWFNKFKENLEVYIYSEYDRCADPIDNYSHIYYNDGKIIYSSHREEIQNDLKKILDTNDKEKIIDYLTTEFEMPNEFKDKPLVEILSIFISIYPTLFEVLPDNYKNDKKFIKKCINKNSNIYKYIKNDELLNDRDIILTVLKSKNNYNYSQEEKTSYKFKEMIFEKYKNDREIILNLIKSEPYMFYKYSDIYNDDKEMVLAASKIDYRSENNYSLFSDRLKEDRDIVKAIAKEKCCKIKGFWERYNDDKEIALIALNNEHKHIDIYKCILQNLSDRLKNDDEIVFVSVKNNPESFQYVSSRLKKSKELSISALKKDIKTIKYLDNELLNDYEFCKEIIKILRRKKNYKVWYESLQYIKNDKILSDRKFVKEAILNGANTWSPNYVFERFLDDEDIMLLLLIKDDYVYRYLPIEYKDNKKYLFAALTNKYSLKELKEPKNIGDFLKQLTLGTTYGSIISNAFDGFSFRESGNNLKYTSDRLKDDKDCVLYAINQTAWAYQYASDRLKDDEEVIRLFLKQMGIIKSKNNKKNKDDLIFELVKKYPYIFNYLSVKYRSNYKLIMFALEEYTPNYSGEKIEINAILDNLSYEQKKEFYLKAVLKWKKSFGDLEDEFRNDNDIVLNAIKAYGNNLRYASDEYKNNDEYINLARKQMEEYNKYEKFYLDETNENEEDFLDEVNNYLNNNCFDDNSFIDFGIDDLPF